MDVKITRTSCPSYLNTLLNIEEDIDLIYKVDELHNESFFVPIKNKSEDDNYLDITGSPLKVDLNNSSFLSICSENRYNFWNKNEEKYCPLPYEEGMNHVQAYILKNYKKWENVTTWWILDGSTKDRIILFSSLQLADTITRSEVKLQGYLPKNHPTISFESLCKKHFEIVEESVGKIPKIPLKQLLANVSCTYELFGSKISSVNFDDKCDIPGSIYLEINWNQCCIDIPHHSKSKMTIQTVVGQPNSILFQFWQELILLEMYIKALNEYDCETMLNNHWLPSYGESHNNINLIDDIVDTVRSFQHAPKYRNKEDGIELANIVENVGKRCTNDITDQLWVILNKCSTYGALTECLNIIFTEIINLEKSVYIANSNMTSMAQIIRDIVAGKTSVFMLTGTQPIEILIDIGLEKLRKDFSYIFTQFEICTDRELQDLFQIPSHHSTEFSKDISKHIRSALYQKRALINMNFVENRMKLLGQLHTVLETLILLPPSWHPLTSKTIYEHYVSSESSIDSFSDLARNKLYEVNVDIHDVTKVQENVKTLTPIMWRLTLTSLKKNSFSVKNVFHLSQQPIFPPNLYKTDIMHETIGDGDVAYYHYTLLTQITNYIQTNLI